MTRGPAQTIHSMLSHTATDTPDRPAVVGADGTRATFAELDQQTASIAAWLGGHSDRGDRIAIVADSGLAYVQLYYAAPRCGRILSLINQRLSPAEQLAVLCASEPRILVGDANYLDKLPDVTEQVPSLEHVITFQSGRWRQVTRQRPTATEDASPDDPAWLVFTSGSTGAPKGVLHTHRSLTAGVWGTVEGRHVQPHGVYLFPFPMCHIAGYNVLVRHATASTVVLSARFRPEVFVDLVNRHGVTSCSLAPTMLHALLRYVEDTGASMPTLREVAYGSAAIAVDLIDRATAKLHVDFHQGYGMTETGGNVTFLGPAEHRAGAPAILRTAGVPHSAVEVGIVDTAGKPVGPGQTGEVVVRGAQVMQCYWRDDTATAHALTGGWLHTGDIGVVDSAGRLSIVDRRKDVIITGGENVSSREVEDAVSTHSDVDMVAVVGVPDEYWGEAICAVVVPHSGRHLTADTVIKHVRERISPFKRPRHVLFTDELPLTPNGKIAKDVVREYARAQTQGMSHHGR